MPKDKVVDEALQFCQNQVYQRVPIQTKIPRKLREAVLHTKIWPRLIENGWMLEEEARTLIDDAKVEIRY